MLNSSCTCRTHKYFLGGSNIYKTQLVITQTRFTPNKARAFRITNLDLVSKDCDLFGTIVIFTWPFHCTFHTYTVKQSVIQNCSTARGGVTQTSLVTTEMSVQCTISFENNLSKCTILINSIAVIFY